MSNRYRYFSRAIIDVIERPGQYRVGYEQALFEDGSDRVIIHVIVYKWSSSIARRFMSDIDTAHSLLDRPVYAIDNPEQPTFRKFIAKHGFALDGFVTTLEGQQVPLFKRTKPDGRRRLYKHKHHPEPDPMGSSGSLHPGRLQSGG